MQTTKPLGSNCDFKNNTGAVSNIENDIMKTLIEERVAPQITPFNEGKMYNAKHVITALNEIGLRKYINNVEVESRKNLISALSKHEQNLAVWIDQGKVESDDSIEMLKAIHKAIQACIHKLPNTEELKKPGTWTEKKEAAMELFAQFSSIQVNPNVYYENNKAGKTAGDYLEQSSNSDAFSSSSVATPSIILSKNNSKKEVVHDSKPEDNQSYDSGPGPEEIVWKNK